MILRSEKVVLLIDTSFFHCPTCSCLHTIVLYTIAMNQFNPFLEAMISEFTIQYIRTFDLKTDM